MAKVIQLIEIEEHRGEGTQEDICRLVKQLWTLDGKLIAERDLDKSWYNEQ